MTRNRGLQTILGASLEVYKGGVILRAERPDDIKWADASEELKAWARPWVESFRETPRRQAGREPLPPAEQAARDRALESALEYRHAA